MSGITKMAVAEQVETRKTIYNLAEGAINLAGYETEAVAEGALIHLPDGQYAVLKVTIKDPNKFDLNAVRTDYAEKQAKAAERAEAQAVKAAEKAEKERAKAEKAEAKVAKGNEDSEVAGTPVEDPNF